MTLDELLAPDAARNTIATLKREIKSLSQMPERIKLTDEEPWQSEGVRRMRVKGYYGKGIGKKQLIITEQLLLVLHLIIKA